VLNRALSRIRDISPTTLGGADSRSSIPLGPVALAGCVPLYARGGEVPTSGDSLLVANAAVLHRDSDCSRRESMSKEAMRSQESSPDMYVLDRLANDVENLEDILRMLNSDTAVGWHKHWGRHFNRDEVVQALSRLIQTDCVRASMLTGDGKWLQELPSSTLPPGNFDDAWFGLTPRGRLIHTNWEPDGLA
jgi:hypothetical protein